MRRWGACQGCTAATASSRALRRWGTCQGRSATAAGTTASSFAKGVTSTTASRAASRRYAAIGTATSSPEATSGRGRRSAGPGGIWLMSAARDQARTEIAFCEAVLAKGGLNVLSETFAGVTDIAAWEHYPPGEVFDPASNAQWFYHCHPAEKGSAEHGHFHCFLRPEGPEGPIHHLCAVGVDAHGRLVRLFTVNQWVVGDDWADADTTIALLAQFDMQMPRPSYLVNRWLTAVLVAYEDEIAALVRQRDAVIAAHQPPEGVAAREDRALEVTSELLLGR